MSKLKTTDRKQLMAEIQDSNIQVYQLCIKWYIYIVNRYNNTENKRPNFNNKLKNLPVIAMARCQDCGISLGQGTNIGRENGTGNGCGEIFTYNGTSVRKVYV